MPTYRSDHHLFNTLIVNLTQQYPLAAIEIALRAQIEKYNWIELQMH